VPSAYELTSCLQTVLALINMKIATFESSLYQLTQDLDKPLGSISIGAETLKSYVSAVVDLVVEKQLRATVWVKLPQTKSWLNQIQKLHQEGNAECIYLGNSSKNQLSLDILEQKPTKTRVNTLNFSKNPIIQRESFLIVLAPNFYCLLLAQWQKSQIHIETSGKRLQQPYLKMVSSFDPQIIELILAGIQQNLLDPELKVTRESDFAHKNLSLNLDKSQVITHPHLLNELLLKQIEHTEAVQKAWESLAKPNHFNHLPEKNPTVLSLQEDFINNLVQELRSPITHMKTALSLLESKQIKGEQRQRYLQMVSEQCDRQNSLVGGLLDLLQLDSPIEAESLNLDDIVPGLVSTYQPLAEEREIQLGYTIPANLPQISCPYPWFRQIMINLLNNSLQFTPPKGKVFVQAAFKNDNEYVEILVSDTGVGIPQTEINKIFDGFYRSKPLTKEKLTGAGLGLTLVRQLILRCGGTISVSSQMSKGTTFKILMPAIPAELVF
jgi:two-component system, OmpR family, phosphate regulon sensor histidine kinase PhoR